MKVHSKMPTFVALAPITGGINLSTSRAELVQLGLSPGHFTLLSPTQMNELRRKLEQARGRLPEFRSGGSLANTAELIARAGLSCGVMGLGGHDAFGRAYRSRCHISSLKLLSPLKAGAFTGYDFDLTDQDQVRTCVLTHGVNAALSPADIKLDAIRRADFLLIDGFTLALGPKSEAAVTLSIETAEEAQRPFLLTLASTRILRRFSSFYQSTAPRAQMLAGNLEQASVFLGLPPDASLELVTAKLADRSINAVITMDSRGAFARIGEEQCFVACRRRDVVDDTGAGDAFLAAFLVARRKGLSVARALSVGHSLCAEVIQYDSARLPLEVDVSSLFRRAFKDSETFKA